jgi:hypothetical protein
VQASGRCGRCLYQLAYLTYALAYETSKDKSLNCCQLLCGLLIGFKPPDHDHILRSHYRKSGSLLVFRSDILLESEAGAT